MNQDCWLAINGVKPEWSGQNYINTLTNYVNMFTKAGLAVILELHWSAPGNYQATKQYPMPDRDHTITFWKSVAKHFSRNKRVIFELFNEPFPDNNNWNSAEGWRCWRDGGTCSGMSYQVSYHIMFVQSHTYIASKPAVYNLSMHVLPLQFFISMLHTAPCFKLQHACI